MKKQKSQSKFKPNFGLFLVRVNKMNKRSVFLGLINSKEDIPNFFPDEYKFNLKYNPRLTAHNNELMLKDEISFHPLVGYYLNVVDISSLDYCKNYSENPIKTSL